MNNEKRYCPVKQMECDYSIPKENLEEAGLDFLCSFTKDTNGCTNKKTNPALWFGFGFLTGYVIMCYAFYAYIKHVVEQ